MVTLRGWLLAIGIAMCATAVIALNNFPEDAMKSFFKFMVVAGVGFSAMGIMLKPLGGRVKNAEQPQEQSVLTTPTSEQGVRDFFDGLAAIHETLQRGAPAQVALAITPNLASLLEQFCSADPRYKRVMADVWIQDYQAIKANGR